MVELYERCGFVSMGNTPSVSKFSPTRIEADEKGAARASSNTGGTRMLGEGDTRSMASAQQAAAAELLAYFDDDDDDDNDDDDGSKRR